MKQSIVKIESLSHKYTRDWAIRDIGFEVDKIGILGLLGSNGAGKSTIMNILCGVLNQTEGNVFIDDIDLRSKPEDAKRLLGFLPQNAPLHLELTVEEYLTYCANIRDIEKNKIKSAVDGVMEKCGVSHFSKRLLQNLSGGYRQRVGIAQAIIHQPKLVVLDEPTNGLDPNQIIEVRKLIKEIGEERAVIFSSHILSEVQAICKQVKMIESGRMVFSDSMDAFNNYVLPDTMIVSMDNPPSVEELNAFPGVTKVELLNDRSIRLHFTPNKNISKEVIAASVQRGWELNEIMFERTSLDEVFAQLSNKTKR
ncbi:ABC-2 type transport system ATP-binding protein [Pedobacter steynii]|uniref:ABC-2 type transport system ATP-binding protein n=1 Tax=Pedobacter steynii TaxID=430522 RepID=A0A1G9P5M3_9SPHI|nr:ATP-binding cassette domain-containing protein [Pedobacter steynii]NQX39085.1 ATP-binding cassette domain-containing protein [Pedobacter steynii]SDL94118.1 ABC-2 type transport system ATP-binding protein [Pedobacter steynii]